MEFNPEPVVAFLTSLDFDLSSNSLYLLACSGFLRNVD